MAVLNILLYFYYEDKSHKIRTALHIEIPLGPSFFLVLLFIFLAIGHEGILVEHSFEFGRFFFNSIFDLGLLGWLPIAVLVILVVFFILIIVEIVEIVVLVVLTGQILGRRDIFLFDLLEHGFGFEGPSDDFIDELEELLVFDFVVQKVEMVLIFDVIEDIDS